MDVVVLEAAEAEDGEDEAVEIEAVEEEGGVEDEVCKLLLITL